MIGTTAPKKRSKLRKLLGKRYYIFKRSLEWYFGNKSYAKNRVPNPLTIKIFAHHSTLLRQLQGLEMYLQHNKVTNLKIAVSKLNGIIIQPNEVFSFWYLVGDTTRKKGYKAGMMLDQGKIVSGIGGGLCQLSNLIYWMVLHSPLTVTERWRHSYDVFPDAKRTLPFGSGATVAYNYVDLQFKNETKQAFQLKFWFDDQNLNGAIYTTEAIPYDYKIEERNHLIQGEVWGGYTRHNQIFRVVYDKNEVLVKEELLTQNHAIMMYQPFLE